MGKHSRLSHILIFKKGNKTLIPKIYNLCIFFLHCVFISFISSAVFSILCIKYYEVALVYHCTVSKINAFIPPGKSRGKVYDFVIILGVKVTYSFTQIPFLRNTVYSLNGKVGIVVFYFCQNLMTQVIKTAIAAKIKRTKSHIYSSRNFGGGQCV